MKPNNSTEPKTVPTSEPALATTEPIEVPAPAEPAETSTPATLPVGYLADGYNAATDKGATYLKPEYVSTYAKDIAVALAITPNDFAPFIRILKKAKKSTLPFEARQTAIYELYPKAQALVRRKKASRLLLAFIEANTTTVHTDADWQAMYRHFEAIAGYLDAQQE